MRAPEPPPPAPPRRRERAIPRRVRDPLPIVIVGDTAEGVRGWAALGKFAAVVMVLGWLLEALGIMPPIDAWRH